MKKYILKINKVNNLSEIVVDWNVNKIYIPPKNGIFQKEDNKYYYYNLYINDDNDVSVVKSVIDMENGNYFFNKNDNLFFLKGKKNFLIIKNFENDYTICEIKNKKIIMSENIEVLKINFLKQKNNFVIHYNKRENLIYFKMFIKLKRIIEINRFNKNEFKLIKIYPKYIIGFKDGKYFLFKRMYFKIFNLNIFIFHPKFSKISFSLSNLLKKIKIVRKIDKINDFYFIVFNDSINILFLDPKFSNIKNKFIMNLNEKDLKKYYKILLEDIIVELTNKNFEINENFKLKKSMIEKIKENANYLNIEKSFLDDILILKDIKNIMFFKNYLKEQAKTDMIKKILNYYINFDILNYFINHLKEVENVI